MKGNLQLTSAEGIKVGNNCSSKDKMVMEGKAMKGETDVDMRIQVPLGSQRPGAGDSVSRGVRI